jgi:hypothetical protein
MYYFSRSNLAPQTAGHNPVLDDMERLTPNQPGRHQQDEYDSSPEHHSTHADHGQEYDPTVRTWPSISRYFPDNHQTSSAHSTREHNGPQSNSRPRQNAHHQSGNQDRYIAAGPASWMSPSSTPYVNLGPFAQGGDPHGRSNQPPHQPQPSTYHSTLSEKHSMPRYPQQYDGQSMDFHVLQDYQQRSHPRHEFNQQASYTSTPNAVPTPFYRQQVRSSSIQPIQLAPPERFERPSMFQPEYSLGVPNQHQTGVYGNTTIPRPSRYGETQPNTRLETQRNGMGRRWEDWMGQGYYYQ